MEAIKSKLHLNRNNTNFPLQLLEFIKNLKRDNEYDFLKYYQNVVREYVKSIDIDSRGLLIYHTMGMGKSILSISLAIERIDSGKTAILLLAKSLQSNMRESIHKYILLRRKYETDYLPKGCESVEDIGKWITKKFRFVSMNASNMIDQLVGAASGQSRIKLEKSLKEIMKLPTLDNQFIIVDEAHDLFRAITNGSKNGQAFYEMVMKAKNLSLFFCTGTPISNNPFELVPCFNMLGSKNGVRILPEDYKEFSKLFMESREGLATEHGGGILKNKNKLQNRILGLTSYIDHTSTPGKGVGINSVIDVNFPTKLPTILEYVNMDEDQYTEYKIARDLELNEGSTGKFAYRPISKSLPPLTKPQNDAASTYRVKTRQLGNYFPNSRGDSPKFKKILENIDKFPDQNGMVYSQFVGIGGLEPFSKFLDNNGWEEYKIEVDASIPSIETIAETISEEFKEGGDDNKPKRRYAIISGDITTDVRDKIQKIFNDDNNVNGKYINLLLISASGAQGLDLKNVMHVHIMESYWNMSRVHQIESRAARNDSHMLIDESKRIVTSFIYIAIPPVTEILPEYKGKVINQQNIELAYPMTTDVELYRKSLINEAVNITFTNAIQETSIECIANGGEHCKKCLPNNRQLFTDNIRKDISGKDPCEPMTSEKITVNEIIVDGVSYYYQYAPSNDSIFDYKIFIHDKLTNVYRILKESDPIYQKINELIEIENTK